MAYRYDGTRHIVCAAQVPIVSELKHTALGQPKSWTWSNGDKAERTYDADGRMTANEFASYVYDAGSRITGITQHLWASRTVSGVVTPDSGPGLDSGLQRQGGAFVPTFTWVVM